MQTEVSNIDLSVIIVYYKTPQLLFNCIESIYNTTKGIFFEIIIIDNHSEDNCENLIKSTYCDVKWLELSYNAGFARANNVGLKISNGAYVLLLNSDTIITEGAIKRCFEILNQNSTIGALGCRLLNRDGSLQVSAFSEVSNIRKILGANPFCIYFTRKRNIQKKRELRKTESHSFDYEPEWICGAFMLLPSKIFKELGLFFDEDFFMYSEDVLLCQQIKKAGYKILYTPIVSIYHLSGASVHDNNVKMAQITISEWLLMVKLYSKFYFIFYIILCRFNFFIDSILSIKSKLLKKEKECDRNPLIYNKFVLKLMKRYFLRLLFKYHKKKSRGKYLRYI